jgi:hypothetical protein
MIIVKDFAEREVLPIKIDEVAAKITERGFVDHILFNKIDDDILGGMLLKRKFGQSAVFVDSSIPRPYSQPREIANIVYSTAQPKEWQRLVACKELLHI